LASAIEIATDPANPGRQLAYVSTTGQYGSGRAGLAIEDVTRFDRPVLVGQLDLGRAVDVAVARLVAVADNSSAGRERIIHLVDISDPTRPQLVKTIHIDSTGSDDPSFDLSNRIEFFDGLLYVAVGNDLVAYDYVAMEEVQRLSFQTNIMRLRRDGTNLF